MVRNAKTNDIRKVLQAVCGRVPASPEFKGRLLVRLLKALPICLGGFRRGEGALVKCRDCGHRGENYYTPISGLGLYRFSYCQRLIHDCFVVEPDIERQCEGFKKREDVDPMGMKS